MCIRDRVDGVQITLTDLDSTQIEIFQAASATWCDDDSSYICLLYTSDAADERSSVDLGGRRIIKKKNHNHTN